jgi:outer membrane protein assembly factor BamB
MRCACLAVLAFLLLPVASLQAGGWPEFRGPTGQGHYQDGKLPVTWNSTKNIAWKREIPGRGWSSPVVFDGKIYLTTAVPLTDGGPNDQSLRALCLDAVTGRTVWEKEVFREDGATAPPVHIKNSHASATPVVGGNKLYVHFGHQGTACLDLSGNILWQNRSLHYNPVHGNGGSPILVDNLLIFSCDGGDQAFVAALEASTGKLRWKTERSVEADRRFSFSTPLLITVNGRKQLISPSSRAVYAYDPETGKEIWLVRYDGYSVIPRPVCGHGLVFISTGYNAPSLLAIRPDGRGDITDTHIAWRTNHAAPHAPCPLLVGEELYMVSDNGIASCLDAKTGRRHWGEQRIGGTYSASPIDADGKIYFLSEQGTGIVIKAGRRYEKLASNALEESALASYAAADGALFIRTQNHLYRIETK